MSRYCLGVLNADNSLSTGLKFGVETAYPYIETVKNGRSCGQTDEKVEKCNSNLSYAMVHYRLRKETTFW